MSIEERKKMKEEWKNIPIDLIPEIIDFIEFLKHKKKKNSTKAYGKEKKIILEELIASAGTIEFSEDYDYLKQREISNARTNNG